MTMWGMCGVVSKEEGGWGPWGLVGLPDGPRPLLQQHQGGMPILVSDEASRWLQQRCATAGGGEDHWQVCCRGSSDGESCVREDRRQVSSSIGDLSGGLVGGIEAWLRIR